MINKILSKTALTKKRKKLGRGIGSEKGRNCGKGTKGQRSRSGFSLSMGFEGGQTPIFRRLPKIYFKTNKVSFCTISINRLQYICDKYMFNGKYVSMDNIKRFIKVSECKTKLVGESLVRKNISIEVNSVTQRMIF